MFGEDVVGGEFERRMEERRFAGLSDGETEGESEGVISALEMYSMEDVEELLLMMEGNGWTGCLFQAGNDNMGQERRGERRLLRWSLSVVFETGKSNSKCCRRKFGRSITSRRCPCDGQTPYVWSDAILHSFVWTDAISTKGISESRIRQRPAGLVLVDRFVSQNHEYTPNPMSIPYSQSSSLNPCGITSLHGLGISQN